MVKRLAGIVSLLILTSAVGSRGQAEVSHLAQPLLGDDPPPVLVRCWDIITNSTTKCINHGNQDCVAGLLPYCRLQAALSKCNCSATQ
jgi:hypothetical protein